MAWPALSNMLCGRKLAASLEVFAHEEGHEVAGRCPVELVDDVKEPLLKERAIAPLGKAGNVGDGGVCGRDAARRFFALGGEGRNGVVALNCVAALPSGAARDAGALTALPREAARLAPARAPSRRGLPGPAVPPGTFLGRAAVLAGASCFASASFA